MNTTGPILRKQPTNYSTEKQHPRCKKTSIMNRNASIGSQKEREPNKQRSKSAGKKKKSRSKSKKKAKGNSLQIAMMKAEDKKLNVTTFVPKRSAQRDRLSQTKTAIRKKSLSASSRQKGQQVNLNETSDDSRSRTSTHKSYHSHSSKKSSKSKRKRYGSLKSDLGHHSSKEFTLQGSQDRRAQQKLRQLEIQEELYETRNQLNQYKQIVYDMKKQLDKASQQQDQILEQQQKYNQYISKAEKYKTIAKEYKKEAENLKKTIEKEKSELNQREQQRQEKEQSLIQKQNNLVNEMIIGLQKMQLCVNKIDSNGQLSGHINDLFYLIQNFHLVTNSQYELSQQISASDLLQDYRNLNSNYTSEELHQQLSQTYLSTSRIGGEIEQTGTGNNPCSQTQALNYSIFSPQFMKSSDRKATQGFSNNNFLGASSETDPSNQMIMDNVTLNWDQSAQHCKQQESHSKVNSQLSGVPHSQSQQQVQIELLMKIQQEMFHLRDQSKRANEENMLLKNFNEQLMQQLEQYKKSQQSTHRSKYYNETVEEIRLTNGKLLQKIEELEAQQKNNQIQKENAQEMRKTIRKFEIEVINLKQEKLLQMQQIESLQRSHNNQEKMLSLMMSQNMPQYSKSQILPESRNLTQNNSRSQNFTNPSLTEQQSICEINQPYANINASEIYSSRQRNSSVILDRFKDASSLDSVANEQLRNRSYYGNRAQPINPYQTHLNQKASIQLETGTQDKDQNLFSLSSTQKENVGAIIGNKENFAPKSLDFNFHNGEQEAQKSAFSLIRPENQTIAESIYTDDKHNMIKIEDTLRYSSDPFTAGISQVNKSTMNVSTRNLIPISLGESKSKIYDQVFEIQQKNRNPQMINISSASDIKVRNNNHQINYTETSDQSLKQKRYQNFYDAKNVTQLFPHQIFVQDSMYSQDTLQAESQSKILQKPLSRTANMGGIKDQSSRKALTMINNSSSNDFSKKKSYDSHSPTFQSQSVVHIGSDRENYNLQNINPIMENGSLGFGQDFSNPIFNYTGTLSHEEAPISTQGNQQNVPHLFEDKEHVQNDQQANSGQNSTNNNSMSVRTINLKKEIISLDQEIILLQNSLKDALTKKEPIMSYLH